MISGRRSLRRSPSVIALEPRLTLTTGAFAGLQNPVGFPPVRPNLPVLPIGAGTGAPTFIEPSSHIVNGKHIIISGLVYVGPYSVLNASGGFIKIGPFSSVLDNAEILSRPLGSKLGGFVGIGDQVIIEPGATVEGASMIGSFDPNAAGAEVGADALIDNATIEPGAFVGDLARVGPGVTVPSGMYVLPGANVTTDAEASNPALGMVRPVTTTDTANLNNFLGANQQLTIGYRNLAIGNSATGASPFFSPTISTVNNLNLSAVSGLGLSPVTKTNATSKSPKFPFGNIGLKPALLYGFPARIVGRVNFYSPAKQVRRDLGKRNSIRADEGSPFNFYSAPRTGTGFTVIAPVQGALNFGSAFKAGRQVIVLGGPDNSAASFRNIGDNVTIESGSVIDRTNIGSGAVIGARSVLINSTIPAGATVPPGTIEVNNVVTGSVEW